MKNPFLSMWLSGANALVGHARSRATAELQRQSAAMMSRYIEESMRLWLAPAGVSLPKQRKRHRR
jgi:hypothetical protein